MTTKSGIFNVSLLDKQIAPRIPDLLADCDFKTENYVYQKNYELTVNAYYRFSVQDEDFNRVLADAKRLLLENITDGAISTIERAASEIRTGNYSSALSSLEKVMEKFKCRWIKID